jgi:hypothetical protein
MSLSKSALKVPYDLRPAKQIERRMLLDVFQILSNNGFTLREYQYTGMGSINFVDFILLHKLLGIKRLVSAEYDQSLKDRVEFNKPFADVTTDMRSIGEVVATLDRDRKHIVWLDYDFRLDRLVVEDILTATKVLGPESILLVTVDIEPPDVKEGSPAAWKQYYELEGGEYFGQGWTVENFGQQSLAVTNASILFNVIYSGLNSRTNVEFFPLFNFEYADGHRMLTVGGMIGTEENGRRLDTCDFSRANFIRRTRTETPFHIRVPKFTRKERLSMDQHMPCADDWQPKEFFVDPKDIGAYRDIYRYYPAFAELLI